MDRNKRNDLQDRERKIRRVEKGNSKLDKHRKIIYNMSSFEDEDDEFFDEVLDYAYANQKINKRR